MGEPDAAGREPMSRVREQLDELLAARDQMAQLVRVIVEIGSDLDLDVTLRRIVSAAMELTGARYGALGIRGSDGALASFVTGDSTTPPRGGSAICRWVKESESTIWPPTRRPSRSPPVAHPFGRYSRYRLRFGRPTSAPFTSPTIGRNECSPTATRARCAPWPRRRPPSTTRGSSSGNASRRGGRRPVARSPPRCCPVTHRRDRCSSS